MRNNSLCDREELEAGKIAGHILTSEYHKRSKLIEKIPENLKESVFSVISYYENIEIKRLAEEIAKLNTRIERYEALQRVDFHLRRSVKEMVVEFFERGRIGGMD